MNNPNTIVIVGGDGDNQAKLETRLKPTRLEGNVGMAVTSLYHGEVMNINETNNTIHFSVLTAMDAQTTQAYEFRIPIGNYPTTASILKAISQGFKDIIWGKDRFIDRSYEPKLVISVEREMGVSIKSVNIEEIPVGGSDTPWSLTH